jgi:rRNA maturation endonuclease Nob1
MAEAQAQIYKTNKEQINEYNREYHRAYRSAHKQKINEKFICDVCGGKATRSNISKHLKTTKHLKFVQSQNK